MTQAAPNSKTFAHTDRRIESMALEVVVLAKLEVREVNKRYGQIQVLKNISFSVGDGEFLSFLGPSGCGKTTILKIITGLEQPDSGELMMDGRNILDLPTEKRNIGMVFQNYALFPHMTVFGNVAYGLKIRRVPKNEINQKVEQALDLVRMSGTRDRKVTELSGGQQQRIALARALVIEPDILLLDEPLSALDRKIRTEMQEELRKIQQTLKITTIFVTHDQEEAMSMSDQIILMNHGEIEQKADPQTLYRKPASVFASNFLGKSTTLSGIIRRHDSRCFLDGGNWSFEVIVPDHVKSGTAASAAVCGENFIVSKTEHPGFCKAEIVGKFFLGTLCKLAVHMGTTNAEVVLLSRDAIDYLEGDSVYIGIKPENIIVFPEVREDDTNTI